MSIQNTKCRIYLTQSMGICNETINLYSCFTDHASSALTAAHAAGYLKMIQVLTWLPYAFGWANGSAEVYNG